MKLDRIQDASERDIAIGNIERDSGRLREHFGTLMLVLLEAAIPWASSCIVCQEAADR